MKKVFLGFLGLSVVVCGELAFLSFEALQETNLEAALERYFRYNYLLTAAGPLCFLVLTGLGSVLYYRHEAVGYFLLAVLFLVMVTVVDYGFIGEAFFRFKQRHGLWQGGFGVSAVMGATVSALGVIFVGLNYLSLRILRKYLWVGPTSR